MSLINVKCISCGKEIELDDAKKIGFCMYCGSEVKIEEISSKVKTDEVEKIHTYLELGNEAIIANNYKQAYEYSLKALEISPKSSESWFFKMKSLDGLSTSEELRIDEIINSGLNSIKYSPKNEDDIYMFFLSKAYNLCKFAEDELLNVIFIKKTYEALLLSNFFQASQDAYDLDSKLLNVCLNCIYSSISLKKNVPEEKIEQNNKYQEILESIITCFINAIYAYDSRLKIYGHKALDLEYRETLLNDLKKGLPEELQKKYKLKSMPEGCYIATAVYGSYNAPEVKVLRKFRDEYLKKYFLGKFFIKIYYILSPFIADKMRNTKKINYFVRKILDKIVNRLNNSNKSS